METSGSLIPLHLRRRSLAASEPRRSLEAALPSARQSPTEQSGHVLGSTGSTPRPWSRTRTAYSDWVIHLYRPKSSTTKLPEKREKNRYYKESYYIQSKILDSLPKERIPLFHRILSQCMEEIGENESRLVIKDNETADGFAIFLDLLYAKNEQAESALLNNPRNRRVLHRFAEYFGAKALKGYITENYCHGPGTMQSTKRMAELQHDSNDGKNDSDTRTREPSPYLSSCPVNILEVSKTIVQNPSQRQQRRTRMSQVAELLPTMEEANGSLLEPENLLRLLKQRHKEHPEPNRADSEIASCLVAFCIEKYKSELTRDVFYQLTRREYMTYIDQEAAIRILTAEVELDYWKDPDNLSSVQTRCTRSLLEDFEGFRNSFGSDDDCWKALRGLAPNVLALLLTHAKTKTSADDLSLISCLTDDWLRLG
jgi:hypothetical protein